ncbi:MAG: hypothetical protein JEZ08_21950 [Clostridiales bacterium]|nr:hypothetical protein [Clostridiales bacterium]
MKRIIAIGLVLILFTGVYLTFNLEGIFASSAPVIVGEGVSNEKILENIESLDIDTYSRGDLINLFGEPESYVWGDAILSIDELDGFYIMVYSNDFHIWMADNSIVELRFYSDFYQSKNNVSVGMNVEEVVEKLGEPNEIRTGESNGFIDDVLYKDIDNDLGYCYYSVPEENARLFFKDYKVLAMYITCTNPDNLIDNIKENQPKVTQKRVNEDDIDLPFVNDEEVKGTWKSVDFVKKIDQFKPETKFWGDDLYLEELVFKAEGEFNVRYLKWTKGYVMHSGDKTASEYIIKEIDGAKYMFYEWKSGDYIFRNQKPYYYVLKKEE